MKKYYYIDDSVLLEKNFYLKIEELLQSEKDLFFLVDVSVSARIADYRALSREADALALENMVNLFAALGNTLQIDTNDGFDPAPLAQMAATDSLTVLTQRQAVKDVFSTLGKTVQILTYQDGELVPFLRDTGANGKAFHLERDSYVNAFDIKDLTYVYSPRYGYLKLDKSKEFSGGEGVCYRTYNGLFCKNFKQLMTDVTQLIKCCVLGILDFASVLNILNDGFADIQIVLLVKFACSIEDIIVFRPDSCLTCL